MKTEMLAEHTIGELLGEYTQLCNILARAIVTTKENKKKKSAGATGL